MPTTGSARHPARHSGLTALFIGVCAERPTVYRWGPSGLRRVPLAAVFPMGHTAGVSCGRKTRLAPPARTRAPPPGGPPHD